MKTEARLSDIAIIGIAGTFPGANSIQDFWKNLVESEESIARFDQKDHRHSKGSSSHFVNAKPIIEGYEYFDAEFFHLSDRDAALMDPQHRLLLQNAWHCFEDAGYIPNLIRGKVGVFLASNFNTYQHLESWLSHLWSDYKEEFANRFSAYTGNIVDTISTRISYKLGLKGPSLSVQTACSSSLVAIHLACQSLLLEESDVALAGAAALSFPMERGYQYEEGMILSSDGHVRSFDERANGTVFGNGVATAVLKPLDKAIADNDHIYGVIKGSAINNDGSDKVDFNAPSFQGQVDVLKEAYRISGVSPETIGYIEAHGTGTKVGDPIEVAALTKAFSHFTSKKQYCAIGSVKTNIGHLDAAAGMAGLIKCLLCLYYKKIPPTLHFTKENQEISFASSPFFVVDSLKEWEREEMPRRAGVTSLGIGGTNAHIVLEEVDSSYYETENFQEGEGLYPILLSAGTKEQLINYLGEFADWIENSGYEGKDLTRISNTLLNGRIRVRWRFYTEVSSISDLIEKCRQGEELYDGSVDDREIPDFEPQLRKIPLPGYPFAKKRYWFDQIATLKKKPLEEASNLHPFIHTNVSTLKEQKFETFFKGNEQFLEDHQIHGKKILPASAYIEMLRIVSQYSNDAESDFVINGISFKSPIVVDDEVSVITALYPHREGVNFEFRTKKADKDVVCSKGYLSSGQKKPSKNIDLSTFLKDFHLIKDRSSIYKKYKEEGINYGPSFQVVEELYKKEKENQKALFMAKIRMSQSTDGPVLYPPQLIDSVFHAASGITQEAFVPYEIGAVTLVSSPTETSYAVLEVDLSSFNKKSDSLCYDATLFTDQGEEILTLSKVIERRVESFETKKQIRDVARNSHFSIDKQYLEDIRIWFVRENALPDSEVDIDDELEQFNIDSVQALSLANKIEKIFGPISKSIFFEHRTLKDVALHLFEKYPKKTSSGPVIKRPTAIRSRFFEEKKKEADIAIVGLSGRYPDSKNYRTLWEHLLQGKNLITEVPKSRWNHDLFYSETIGEKGKTYSKWGGFIEDFDCFDPLFFKIAPREAEIMDPQERLFIETAWESLEDAGYTPTSLGELCGHNIGVYVGSMYGEYQLYGPEERAVGNEIILNGILSSISNRVSFLFDFRGPSFTVDTMCSSSLTALYLAYNDLINRKTNAAIVGGVNLTAHPNKYLQLAQERMLSKRGLCQSFGKGDGGYVPSEGVGAILMKPLKNAIADNDHIYAVIKSVEINHGGKTNSFTVPNAKAQSEVIEKAIESSGVSPENISYIEAHGTGTHLGDPIEIQGLSAVFSKYTEKKQFCSIGSLKSNLGHTEAAAGIAGLTKVLLQLKYKKIVPSIHSEVLNPAIDFTSTPFVVSRSLQEWKNLEESIPLYAALSSFGAGGSNAHVILEERISSDIREKPASKENLIILSARSEMALIQMIRQFRDFMRSQEGQSCRLDDIAYTLQVGRLPLKHRLAYLCSSHQECMEILSAACEKKDHPKLQFSQVEERRKKSESAEMAIANRDLNELSKLWLKGYKIFWNELADDEVRKVSLPTYPFEKTRYWFEKKTKTQSKAASYLHPLVHENVSTLEEIQFVSHLSPNNSIIGDHRIDSKSLMPGAGYIEMALFAGKTATQKSILSVKNIKWLSPCIFNEKQRKLWVTLVAGEDQTGFEIWSANANGEKSPQSSKIFCQGFLSSDAVTHSLKNLEIETAFSSPSKTIESKECYEKYRELNFQYGPSYRSIETLWLFEDHAIVKAKLPENDSLEGYLWHPVLMDATFQSPIVFDFDEKEEGASAFLPYSIKSFTIFQPLSHTIYIKISRPTLNADGSKFYNMTIYDDEGKVISFIEEFLEKPISQSKKKKPEVVYLSRKWKESSLLTFPDEPRKKYLIATKARLNEIADEEATVIPLEESLDGKEIVSRFLPIFRSIQENIKNKQKCSYILSIEEKDFWMFSHYLGLFKTVRLENPSIFAKMVLSTEEKDFSQLKKVIAHEWASSEKIVRYDKGFQNRYVDQFVEIPYLEKNELTPPMIKKGGVYWITGGMGGLGLVFARYFASKNLETILILSGRSKREEKEVSFNEKVKGFYIPCDVSDYTSVENTVSEIRKRFGKLDGVIHAAGVNRDSLILNKKEKQIETVFQPKVMGTLNIDNALGNTPLDYFVLFSSDSSVYGNVGQSDYAAANAFLDGFVSHRNELSERGQRSGITKVINWPYWEAGGMQIDEKTKESIYHSTGILPLDTETGTDCFEKILSSRHPQVIVAKGNKEEIRSKILKSQDISSTQKKEISDIEAGFIEKVRNYFREMMSEQLRIPSQTLTLESEFEDFGVDSILSMNIITELEKVFGTLSKTLFFEFLTFRDFVDYFLENYFQKLEERLKGAKEERKEKKADQKLTLQTKVHSIREKKSQAPFSKKPQGFSDEPFDIAIIGLAGRYPQSSDLYQLWEHLSNGDNCIEEVPQSRWDHSKYFSKTRGELGKSYSKWGGFIPDVDKFDPLFFKISQAEAERLDPQEKLFLQIAWHTIEDAGYTRERLYKSSDGNVGVYVGCMYQEYQLYNSEQALLGNPLALNGSPAMLANRVSYFLNLHGPSLTLDTLCSSSLTTIYLACQSILSGDCLMAIAGGANVNVHPNKYTTLSYENFLSSEGLCKSFGEGGDGYVPSEGIGAVLLKPLKKAVKDHDHIYGVIKGVAINHGGKAKAFTVPSPMAQSKVIEKAIQSSKTSLDEFSYIETHGTGTSLGDPIEISGLSKVFGKKEIEEKLPIGSIKSNLGHCESAAGIAALTKVLLQFKHKTLLPSIHAEILNPNIDFEKGPFKVQRTREVWNPQSKKRIALLSSFGAGGSNASMVIQEHEEDRKTSDLQGLYIFVLSAMSKKQLKKYAFSIHDLLLKGEWNGASPKDLAYTLQIGREAFKIRLAILYNDFEDLSEKLDLFLKDEKHDDLFVGSDSDFHRSFHSLTSFDDFSKTVTENIDSYSLATIAELWTKGMDIQWERFYLEEPGYILSIPGYPFEKERCWFEKSLLSTPQSSSPTHPLLHKNESDVYQQRFISIFHGSEKILSEHLVSREKILPGSATIEMGIEAVKESTGIVYQEIQDITWLYPIAFSGTSLRLQIELEWEDEDSIEVTISDENNKAFVQYSFPIDKRSSFHKDFFDITKIKEEQAHTMNKNQVYKKYRDLGIEFGKSFQSIVEISFSQNEFLSKIHLSSIIPENYQSQCSINPYLLDAAFQSTIALSNLDKDLDLSLPFSIERIQFKKNLPLDVFVYGKRKPGKVEQYDLYVLSLEGELLISISELKALSMRKKEKLSLDDILEKVYLEDSDQEEMTELVKGLLGKGDEL